MQEVSLPTVGPEEPPSLAVFHPSPQSTEDESETGERELTSQGSTSIPSMEQSEAQEAEIEKDWEKLLHVRWRL